MRKKFDSIPSILQKQILLRGIVGAGCLVMAVVTFVNNSGVQLVLPCSLISGFFLASARDLYSRCIQNRYVVISGICTGIDRAGLQRKIKSLYVRTDAHTVRLIRPNIRLRSLQAGDKVTLYLADNTPVYEVEDCKAICRILAMEKEM